ncbi:uncharacterized protein LOC113375701 [Ctenocephalides felis]|uniref:uncharacterized protein LOC113375701 n=1 Tax=Ctenocephalides felis TaxID=7515 RepID=UPI000E6E1F7A|nr:uncharacterized protein LOC113375701 [Ctenocephalides felis]
MSHLKSQPIPSPTCPRLLNKTVTTLFPRLPILNYQVTHVELNNIPPITLQELMEACHRVGIRKKPPDEQSSYRPICMLDTAGKIFETIIHQRIDAIVDQILADNQYGFRKGRSTINDTNLLVNTAKEGIAGTRWKGEHADEHNRELMERITEACDISMTRKHGINQRQSVH